MDQSIKSRLIPESFGLNVGHEPYTRLLPEPRIAQEELAPRNHKGSDPLALPREEALDILAAHAVTKLSNAPRLHCLWKPAEDQRRDKQDRRQHEQESV
jgi:hypothetical protein